MKEIKDHMFIGNSSGLYKKCEKCLTVKHTSNFRQTPTGKVVFKSCKECRVIFKSCEGCKECRENK
jgi:hypothetical protein